MAKKHYKYSRSNDTSKRVVWFLTPNGCLDFVLRIIGILFVVGLFVYLYLNGDLA